MHCTLTKYFSCFDDIYAIVGEYTYFNDSFITFTILRRKTNKQKHLKSLKLNWKLAASNVYIAL